MFEVPGQKEYCAFLSRHERLARAGAKIGHRHPTALKHNKEAIENNLAGLEQAVKMGRRTLWEMFYNQPWDHQEDPRAENVAIGISLSRICERRE